jgi:hypothetical protein
VNNKLENKSNKNEMPRLRKILQTSKKYIKYLLLIAQILTPVFSVYVIWKTNTLTNTANLLQINNAIQIRTDIVNSVEMELKELKLLSNENIDVDQVMLLNEKRLNAITALLNTYEFACQQYINNKIDKAAFKLFFSELIKYIKEEKYNIYLIDIEKYSAINNVYKEWHGNK